MRVRIKDQNDKITEFDMSYQGLKEMAKFYPRVMELALDSKDEHEAGKKIAEYLSSHNLQVTISPEAHRTLLYQDPSGEYKTLQINDSNIDDLDTFILDLKKSRLYAEVYSNELKAAKAKDFFVNKESREQANRYAEAHGHHDGEFLHKLVTEL